MRTAGDGQASRAQDACVRSALLPHACRPVVSGRQGRLSTYRNAAWGPDASRMAWAFATKQCRA